MIEFGLLLIILIIVGMLIFLNKISVKINQLENDIQNIKNAAKIEGTVREKKPLKKPEQALRKSKIVSVTKSSGLSFIAAKQETRLPRDAKTFRTRSDWEELIGGKLLNWIGAVALIIAVGFFLKYAFDNNWITESVRVLIGAIIGIGLLVTGVRFHKKELFIFTQGIFGA